MFPANCLVMFKNGTTILIENGNREMLKLGTLNIRNKLPARATATYSRLPILFKIGPKVFAYLLAVSDTWNSSSLIASKAFSLSSSWQNTLMTFWPFIISSTKPSVLPIAFCCWIKNFAELPPTFFIICSMSTTPATTTSAIQIL